MTETELLSEQSARQVIAVYDHVGDFLTVEDLMTAAPALIARHNAEGVRLAHLALGAVLAPLDEPVEAAGLAPMMAHFLDVDRLTAAVRTVLQDQESARTRLERLARSEPLEATQRTVGSLIDGSPGVTGWVRQLEPDACQLCTWWSRDGRVWPSDHRMPTHKGCNCTQRPITT